VSRKVGLFWDTSIPYRTIFKVCGTIVTPVLDRNINRLLVVHSHCDASLQDVDLANPSVQRDAAAVLTALAEDTQKSEGPVDWWLDDFKTWAPTQVSLVFSTRSSVVLS